MPCLFFINFSDNIGCIISGISRKLLRYKGDVFSNIGGLRNWLGGIYIEYFKEMRLMGSGLFGCKKVAWKRGLILNIKCLASDYIIKETADVYYVYNEIYEDSLIKIIIAALIDLFIPEASDYYLPVCIKISKTKENVVITEKLDIKGRADFKYFIAKHQYQKWKKVYTIVISIIIMLGLAIDASFIYLFLKLEANLLMGACAVIMLIITVGAVVKLELNNRKRMKYEIIDILF